MLCVFNIHDCIVETFVFENQTSLVWLGFKNEKDVVSKGKGRVHLRTGHKGLEWN